MWCVLDLNGDPLATFGSDLSGWRRAVRFAEREGGELDIVFVAHLRAKPYVPRRRAA